MQITCPYCNAVLERDQVESAGARVRCPRCGDAFPNRWANADAPATPTPAARRERSAGEVRRCNRRAALVVVGVMLTSAAAGLFYALRTTPERQSRHPDPRKIFAVQEYRPAQLPALGYLPFDTKMAAAMHVADLLGDPYGKKLLEKPRWRGFDWVLDRVAQWTDLTPEAIDHIAVGINAPGAELPGLTVVVQTRQPYQSSALKKKYSATAPDYFYDRPLFRIAVQPVGDGYLWCADDRTLLMLIRFEGAEREDLDRIPIKAHAGMEGLEDSLQSLIKERLPPRPVAWAVGELDDISKRIKLLPAAPLPPHLLELAGGIRRFAIGAQLQKQEVAVYSAMEARDVRAAYRIQDSLQQLGAESLKVVGLPPAEVLAARCIGQGAIGGYPVLTTPALLSSTWVIVQIRPRWPESRSATP